MYTSFKIHQQHFPGHQKLITSVIRYKLYYDEHYTQLLHVTSMYKNMAARDGAYFLHMSIFKTSKCFSSETSDLI